MALRPPLRDDDPRPNARGDELDLSPVILRALREALRGIRFGVIELVIHDGRVVQLERREKVRFEPEVSDRRR
ncbi:MAG: YezD family protein [Gemmatimonadales bacterium]